jgi:hypothetical protein
MAGKSRVCGGCPPAPPAVGGPERLSSPQFSPTERPGPKAPHPPSAPARLRRPGGPLKTAPSSARRPARAHSLTLGTAARSSHPAQPAPPSCAPARRPRCGCGSRPLSAPRPSAPPPRPPRRGRPLPSPPFPPLRWAPHRRLRLLQRGSPSPRTRRPLRQLNPSPAAPPRRPGPRARGCATGRAEGGRAEG